MSLDSRGEKRKVQYLLSHTELIEEVLANEEKRQKLEIKNIFKNGGSSNASINHKINKEIMESNGKDDTDDDFIDDTSLNDLLVTDDDDDNEKKNYNLIGLTKKFIQYLQNSKSNVIDINVALEQLQVKGKKKIYDIINILENIGLIERKTSNLIQWKGGTWPPKNGQKIDLKTSDRNEMIKLQNEISKLDKKEKELDEYLKYMKMSLKNVCEEAAKKDLFYMHAGDIMDTFEDKAVIVIQAPKGTLFSSDEGKICIDNKTGMNYPLMIKSFIKPITATYIEQSSIPINYDYYDEESSDYINNEYDSAGQTYNVTNIEEQEYLYHIEENTYEHSTGYSNGNLRYPSHGVQYVEKTYIVPLVPQAKDGDYKFNFTSDIALISSFSEDF
ncbi:Transcription factor E2F/dimerisation partner (TDP) domain and Winged helix-turn-helix DNA-binding domain-containing protein [Strongyloides ratti]|uniref:Transcription factor E2F/dimerisation partner (TDP) domain and Winged helix-turn-helix DNA-binding domain-containing protein n=1 Tax=Strongyloides ratti TaxID=34506 RepID=A0A090KUG5_STRRB|nr:Transcription factor E2F/dimerisation partner (TDP) domain and Winged helix-turn-helix DNA-binding domain-containing protein [Strongyloides ratti]CEF61140.1 Transcription factor E2F/dimerisation partner (TDP) domain and Winged helix-turn-helix DNA-binding domain-containing protein [Strongyloides ratti]